MPSNKTITSKGRRRGESKRKIMKRKKTKFYAFRMRNTHTKWKQTNDWWEIKNKTQNPHLVWTYAAAVVAAASGEEIALLAFTWCCLGEMRQIAFASKWNVCVCVLCMLFWPQQFSLSNHSLCIYGAVQIKIRFKTFIQSSFFFSFWVSVCLSWFLHRNFHISQSVYTHILQHNSVRIARAQIKRCSP